MYGSGGGASSKTKDIHISIPRRLATEGFFSGAGEKPSGHCTRSLRSSRSSGQLPKVNLDSNTESSLPGSYHKHRTPKSVSFGGTTILNRQEVSGPVESQRTYGTSGDIATGLHGIMHFYCPKCQTPHETPPRGIGDQLEPKDRSLGGHGAVTGGSTSVIEMVDTQSSPVSGCSVSPGVSIRHPSNGCVSSGMGGSSGSLLSAGSVVRQGKAVPHQSAGTQSGPSGSQVFHTTNSGENALNTDAQYNHDVLLEQTRGNEIPTPIARVPSDMALAPGQRNINYSGAPARSAERVSRFSEQTPRGRSRLGRTRRSRRIHLRAMGSASTGSLRRRSKQEMPRLRIQVLPSGISRECPVDRLVRDISLRFSADSPHSGSDQQTLQNDSYSATMAPSILVHRSPQPVGKTSQEAAVQTRSSEQNGGQNSTSQPTLSELNSMAPEFLQYGHLGLSQECMNILKESKRPSTRRSYAFKWKRFYIWCCQQGHNPIRAQEDVILSYLLHLAKSGLQVSSIEVHLSAITAYRKSPSQESFFTKPVVKDFLEGLKKVFPPIRRPSPPWELNIVLAKLMGPPFEPIHKASLQHLTWKTAFLVAITSARRVSEIQALSSKEPYTVFHDNRVVLRTHPSFLPKVVSEFHINQTISLPTFFPNPETPAEKALHSLDLKSAEILSG
ncbi:hypothetical protein NDU88_001230 [Pleurodeles waltl]|uniref:Core-binding (CB) domain-containing protein n=1 Tax=Pleurodeles waltl TaxID=8319 RepID=A0AAV7LYZ0_PLEWA|nr:hypothetical protein NDU88_001230 [Pleurodeles waltl]